jgi:ribonuclease HI
VEGFALEVFTIHTDGAARGNPGPAAYAFTIERQGQPPIEAFGVLGETTNNIAEYVALVKALERAKEIGARRLLVHSDSELMVKQMAGEYRVKNEGLRPLFEAASRLASEFDAVSFRHVRREQNKRTDELANMALDGDGSNRAPAAKPKSKTQSGQPAKAVGMPSGATGDILECLRSAACAWSAGNPNHPRPEEVWEQLWTIIEDAGVLKKQK